MRDIKIYLNEQLDDWVGLHRFILKDALTGRLKSNNEYYNLITTACKTMIAARLAGGSSDTDITYGAVGTGAGTPAVGDTTLFTELTRKVLAGITSSGGVITATSFFGAADGNGVLTEFSMFGDGATASADSGTMINHVAISETKSSSETLTIESVISL